LEVSGAVRQLQLTLGVMLLLQSKFPAIYHHLVEGFSWKLTPQTPCAWASNDATLLAISQ